MRNLYRNGIVFLLAGCFAAFGFIGTATDAQTKSSKKPTPTPAKKTSGKAMAKATPKPTPKSKTTAVASKTKVKPTPKPSKSPVKTKSNTTAQKEKSGSSTKTTTKSTSKNDAGPTSKKEKNAAPKSTPKSNSTGGGQLIVVATDSRIREQPKASAPQLSSVKIGKLLSVLEKNGSWHRVQYESEKSGWISKTTTKEYESDNRDVIYQEIADKYIKDKSLEFAAAAEVSDFLRTAQALAKKDQTKAELSFKRLRILAAAMKAVPMGKGDAFPYKTFLQAHDKEVVYSEPSATWLVRSDLFWELHGKYTQLPIAEDIAWAAAKNAIPGECEGYINCQLYALRAMEGEYLNFYPNGKYAKQALEIVTVSLGVMVADMNDKNTFTPLADISDRAEFNRFLTELRTIISKVSDTDKAKPLQQINLLGEGYK